MGGFSVLTEGLSLAIRRVSFLHQRERALRVGKNFWNGGKS